jgi:cardiolipin synthase
LLLAGALTDVADGVAARRLGPVTRLGVVIDPVVDIAWNTGAVLALVRAGLLPGWALGLVGVRYGLVLLGSAALYLVHATLRIRATRFGKASGAVIAAALLAVVTNRLLAPPVVAAAVGSLLELVVGFLLWGTIGYAIVLGVLNYRQPERGREPVGRVVGHIR